MTLVQFMERHRHIQFCGVALDGEVTERPCACCDGTERCEWYAFEVDAGQELLLCPRCADAISRALHPETCDRLHSYHVRAWRDCGESIEALPADYPEHGGLHHTEDAVQRGKAGWGVYGCDYEDGLPMHVVDCKTKAEADAWAAYLGRSDHQERLATLEPFIANGRIVLVKTRQDGTLEYDLNMDDPRKSGDLIVHPPGAPLDYEPGPPFYIKTTLYRDKDWHEMVGCDVEDITDEESLVLFLSEYTEPSN